MNKKLNNVSLLRFLSMLSVVVFHALMILSPWKGAGIFPFYCGTHIFFFISGFLYDKIEIKNAKEFYKKRFIKILIPTIFLILFDFVLCAIFAPAALDFAAGGGFASGIFALGHLWFIFYILFCYLILPIMKVAFDSADKHRKKAGIILFFIVLGEVLINVFFNMPPTVIIFVTGFAFSRYKIMEKCYASKVKASIFSALIFLASLGLFKIGRLYGSNLGFFSIFMESTFEILISISLSILILTAFEFLNKKAQPKFLIYSDKYSFYIYLTHHIFALGSLSVLKLTSNVFINIILYLIFTVILTILLSLVSSQATKSFKKFKL